MIRGIVLAFGLFLLVFSANAERYRCTINVTEEEIGRIERKNLLGTQLTMWDISAAYENPKIIKRFKRASIGSIQIPGGGESAFYYWNGNGVRDGKRYDQSRFNNGLWHVDYSRYQPGFLLDWDDKPRVSQGRVDVRGMLDFGKRTGSEAIIAVNVGSGTARDAAEWVSWCNKEMKYDVKYWKIGHELRNDWSRGYFLRDGTTMTSEKYAKIFAEYAKAMKKEDPSIILLGPGEVFRGERDSYIPDLLRLSGSYVDMISIHIYQITGGEIFRNAGPIFKRLDTAVTEVAKLRKWAKNYLPEGKTMPPVAIAEWQIRSRESINTVDLISGLWNLNFICAMAEKDVRMMSHWLAFGEAKGGGGSHGILSPNGERRAGYWAFWLYANHFGDRLMKSRRKGGGDLLRQYASKNSEGNLCLVVINRSEEMAADVTINLPNNEFKRTAKVLTFSENEYEWSRNKNKAILNSGPSYKRMMIAGSAFEYQCPRFSVSVFEFTPSSKANKPRVRLLGNIMPRLPGAKQLVEILFTDNQGDPLGNTKFVLRRTKGNSEIPKTIKSNELGVAKFEAKHSLVPGVNEIQMTSDAGEEFGTVKLLTGKPRIVLDIGPKLWLGETKVIKILLIDELSQMLIAEDVTVKIKKNKKIMADSKVRLVKGRGACAVKGVAEGIGKMLFLAGKDTKASLTFGIAKKGLIEKGLFYFARDKESVESKYGHEYISSSQRNYIAVNVDTEKGWNDDVLGLKLEEAGKFANVYNFNRENIYGFQFDLMLDPAIVGTHDSWSFLKLITHSHRCYWQEAGSVDLHDLPKGKWQTIRLKIDESNQDYLDCIFDIFKASFVIHADNKVKGRLCVDNFKVLERNRGIDYTKRLAINFEDKKHVQNLFDQEECTITRDKDGSCLRVKLDDVKRDKVKYVGIVLNAGEGKPAPSNSIGETSNVLGFSFKMKLGENVKLNPEVYNAIEFVLQTKNVDWMTLDKKYQVELGSLPKGEWLPITILIEDAEQLSNMDGLFRFWWGLICEGDVSGDIYFDDLELLERKN